MDYNDYHEMGSYENISTKSSQSPRMNKAQARTAAPEYSYDDQSNSDQISYNPKYENPRLNIPTPSLPVPSPPLRRRPWRTGLFQNVPWGGLSGLLFALMAMVASTAVLAVSNGTKVSEWSVSPNFVLAILSIAIGNCLSIALYSGVTIHWWRQVLNSAPLAATHRSWAFGNSVVASIAAGRHFNAVSLATILFAFAFFEGPLFQHASSISSRQNSIQLNMSASLAANLPPGYTATAAGQIDAPVVPSSAFSEAFNDYSNNAPIKGGFTGCPGICNVTVPGVGFRATCKTFNTSYSMEEAGIINDIPQFVTNTTWQSTGTNGMYDDYGCVDGCPENLTLNAGWAVNKEPTAFVNRVCNLSLAIVSYPLSLANKTATLELPLGTNPEVVADLPVARTGGDDMNKISTLGGFYLLGGASLGPYYANVSMFTNGASAIFELSGINPFSWSHTIDMNWNPMQFEEYTWRDPTDDILAAYHGIMFRLALKAAQNATLVPPFDLDGVTYSSKKKVATVYHFDESYYVSNFKYMAAAVIVVLIGILGILAPYRGWWEIGRPTTLSPLETAKAFGAPLLADYNSNETADELVKHAGQRRVQYGTMRSEGKWNFALRLADVGMVDDVRPGTVFTR